MDFSRLLVASLCMFALLAAHLCGCEQPVRSDQRFRVTKAPDGSFTVTFTTPYAFGDRVTYKSKVNGEGAGKILDIVVQEDGLVYYAILLENGSIQSGIYRDEMKLISRSKK